jgi:hypothetical protein
VILTAGRAHQHTICIPFVFDATLDFARLGIVGGGQAELAIDRGGDGGVDAT